jgi:paraquat-inducible protein B
MSFNRADIPARVAATVAQAEDLVADMDRKVKSVDASGLSNRAKEALGRLNVSLAKVERVLRKVEGEDGLLESVQRTSDRIGDVADNARGAGEDLDKTLRDLSEASRSVRELVDALEVDPEMLLKGRTPR